MFCVEVPDSFNSSTSCLPDFLPRYPQEHGAVLIRVSFENCQDVYEAFNVFKREDSCKPGIVQCNPRETALIFRTERTWQWSCGVGMWCDHPHGLADYDAPRPGMCPLSKSGVPVHAPIKASHEAPLRLLMIGR